jgi:hypothetical protein
MASSVQVSGGYDRHVAWVIVRVTAIFDAT